jgi:hypothetical protein
LTHKPKAFPFIAGDLLPNTVEDVGAGDPLVAGDDVEEGRDFKICKM